MSRHLRGAAVPSPARVGWSEKRPTYGAFPDHPLGPGSDRGQATVELVALLPLVVAVALAACQVLAAGLARELADHAAEAGAVAALQDADPADAARRALPGWARSRVDVRVAPDTVGVRLRPPALLPGTAGLLEARATAHTTGSGLALPHRRGRRP